MQVPCRTAFLTLRTFVESLLVRPKPCTIGDGEGSSVLLKSRYLRRSFMFRGRMFRGFKLAVTLAFTGLVALATGISCRGFFQADTLSAISLQPPTPQIQVGQSSTIQAWGTYSPDNNRSQIKSGVAWTSSDETVITMTQILAWLRQSQGGPLRLRLPRRGSAPQERRRPFLAQSLIFRCAWEHLAPPLRAPPVPTSDLECG